MNKYFREVLTLKSLEFKVGNNCVPDDIYDKLKDSEELKPLVKNVCAPIPLAMNAKLEEITRLLGISKGRFLTLAIASSIEETNALMTELDITEYLDDSEIVLSNSEEAA